MYQFNEFQEKWLQALESGEYRQGKYNLAIRAKESVEYCCLGVACEIANKYPDFPKVEPSISETRIKFAGEPHLLPGRLLMPLGLRSTAGQFIKTAVYQGNQYVSLTDMNDRGLTHKEIAVYIRKNPDNVFRQF